jgi:hypothetical protein
LDIAPTPEAFTRLRIFEQRVLSIDVMLRFEVVGVGGGPVAIQSCSNLAVFHDPVSSIIAVDL